MIDIDVFGPDGKLVALGELDCDARGLGVSARIAEDLARTVEPDHTPRRDAAGEELGSGRSVSIFFSSLSSRSYSRSLMMGASNTWYR